MEPHGDSKKRSITRRAPRGIEKRLQAVDAVGERLRGSSASHVTVRGSRLEGGTPDATAAQARWVARCLRCLLLVMCTYPETRRRLAKSKPSKTTFRPTPSCPKIQTNSRLARRAVSIVIAPWRALDLGRVGGDVSDSGSPYAQGEHHPATGCHAPGRRPGPRPGTHLDQNVLARYATVAPASILDPSGGLFLAAARPCQRPTSHFGANVALENRD